MSSSKLLRRISIASPCSASWEEMTGNDQVRFCRHCDLNVTDISQLTRAKAVRLVRKSQGKLCLRLHRTPLGEVITRPAVEKLYSISRRASRIAAGTFTAVMTLSTVAYAQSVGTDDSPQEPPVAQQPIEPNDIPATVNIDEPQILGGAMVMIRYQQPLVNAAYDNDLDSLNQLLDEGVDVNQAEDDGTTALEMAVANGNIEMVRRLIGAGANVSAVDSQGETVLFALDGDGTRELVDVLVYAGVNVNQADEEGNTALMNAVEAGSPELVRALIEAGAYVNAQNKEGNSALMIAAQHDNAQAARELFFAGAILGLRNAEGLDALELAEANDNQEVAYLLLEFGTVDIYVPEQREK